MPKILVVEDNLTTRTMIVEYLQRRGFAVVAADDGVEGVKSAGSERPNLVLMDINMPVLDGWEAARQIHASVGLEKLPIIALTANALSDDRRHAMESGCIDYHAKPVQFESLLQQIEKALRGSLNDETVKGN